MKPKEVKGFLQQAVKQPTKTQPVHLWGPPGIGKSALPKQITEELKIGFVDIRLAQRDPTDLRGIPAVIDDQAIWLPPPELPTEWFCLDCQLVLHPKNEAEKTKCSKCGGKKITDKGILFLDELTSAPPLTQATAYQLTLDRRVGEYYLPDGWYVLAAGNRIEDRAVVYRMSTALANRFTHIEVDVNLGNWTDWALSNGINANIVAFLQWRTELLFSFNPESSERAFPSPRSWEFGSRISNMVGMNGSFPELLEGTIGKGATAEYLSFLKIQDELPNLDRIFGGEDYVPKRIDLQYAMIGALVSKADQTIMSDETVDQYPVQFERLLKWSKALEKATSEEFSVLLVMMLVGKSVDGVGKCPSWKIWAKDHRDVMLTKRPTTKGN